PRYSRRAWPSRPPAAIASGRRRGLPRPPAGRRPEVFAASCCILPEQQAGQHRVEMLVHQGAKIEWLRADGDKGLAEDDAQEHRRDDADRVMAWIAGPDLAARLRAFDQQRERTERL